MKVPRKIAAQVEAAAIKTTAVKKQPVVDEYEVVVPICPSVNNLFFTRGKSRVKSKNYLDWLAVAIPKMEKAGKMSCAVVEIQVSVVGPINKSRDLDNLLKPIGDSLKVAGVITDDRCSVVRKWSIEYLPDTPSLHQQMIVRVLPVSKGQLVN